MIWLQLIGLRNADMRRVRGNDEHALTVEQALPFWREQSDRRQMLHLARQGGAAVASGSVEFPLEEGDRTRAASTSGWHTNGGAGVSARRCSRTSKRSSPRRAARSRRRGRSIRRPRASASTPARAGGRSRRITRRRFAARRGLRARAGVPQQLARHPAEPRPDPASCGRPRVRPLMPDYRFVWWEIPTPDERLDDFAWMKSRMSTDAPTGEVEVSEERWDADRVRRLDARDRAAGFRKVVGAAQHVATGRLVAFNELMVDTSVPALTHQNDTLVLREHRGHRLGLLVKCETLLRWLEVVPEARAHRDLQRRGEPSHARYQRGDGLRAGAVRRRVAEAPRLIRPRAASAGSTDSSDSTCS